MLNVLSFFFITQIWNRRERKIPVSMLNVLSFFFIPKNFVELNTVKNPFRCSTFWAFSLCTQWKTTTKTFLACFDAQRFELFLYSHNGKNVNNGNQGCFDAQCFELFLYNLYKSFWPKGKARFRCSTFWAFSLLKPSDTLLWLEMCFDAQCSELFLYPLFAFILYKLYKWVSMLNVLSFFFIGRPSWDPLQLRVGFDAQCSELFLYSQWEIR